MPDQFFQDKKSQKVLKEFFKNAPKAFQEVSAGTLNGLAFKERENYQKSIKKNMQIRTPGLLRKSTRVKMAKKTDRIQNQQSEAFTLTSARHDGWEAVEEGKQTKINVFTDKGRGGDSFSGKGRPGAKIGRAFTGPQDFGFSSSMGHNDVVNYMQRISASPRRRRKSWFLPVWFRLMPPGIYIFQGGKVRKRKLFSVKTKKQHKSTLVGADIVRLSTGRTTFKPKANNWQGEATRQTTKKAELQRIWFENFEKKVVALIKKRGPLNL